jgi:hypothetical protein
MMTQAVTDMYPPHPLFTDRFFNAACSSRKKPHTEIEIAVVPG